MRTTKLSGALCVALAALAVAAGALAQPNLDWANRYGGANNGYDYAYDVAANKTSGSVYITGYTYETSYPDMTTVAYSASGAQLWRQSYNSGLYSSPYDYGRAVAVDPSGNVFAGGYGYNASGNYDFEIVKYNSSGAQQWAQLWNDPYNYYDYLYDLVADSAGNVIAVGYGYGTSSSNYDYLVVKYSGSGSLLWARYYNGAGNSSDYAYGVAVDASNNVFVTGYSYSGSNYDAVTVKYDANGNQLWATGYNGSANNTDYGYDVQTDNAGNAYVAGYSYQSVGSYDVLTYKLSPAGALLWARTYAGPGGSSDYGRAMAVDKTTGANFTGGYTYGSGTSYDQTCVAYDTNGTFLWVGRYNGSYNSGDYGYDIALTDQGHPVVGGYAYSSSPYYADFSIVSWDKTSGSLRWNMLWNSGWYSSQYDYGQAIATDNMGGIAIGGYSYGPNGNYDFATVHYSDTTACTTLRAKAGGPYTRECNGQPSSFQVDGSRSCDPTGSPLTYSWSTNCAGGSFDNPTAMAPNLRLNGNPPCPVRCNVTLQVRNSAGQTASDTTTVTLQDTTRPTTSAPGNQTVECDNVPGPGAATCRDTCDLSISPTMRTSKTPGNCPGNYTERRIYRCTDDCSNYSEATQTLTVRDTKYPVVTETEDDLYCLWSPDHEYYCFGILDFNPTMTDNCSPPINYKFVGCPSDQGDGGGSGSTEDDCMLSQDGSRFCVRAERAGTIYYGRHYSVMISAWDSCFNMSPPRHIGDIYIPHDSEEHLDCLKSK